ncbi:nuclear transport factor 2 family protein [Streptomyces sp. NPDC087512]|uniref:nuclear transport factor 2 family protein n=1 Tax=Streptomyces sp. NPDC087512 TaxID=3155059 RepID=UPI003422D322
MRTRVTTTLAAALLLAVTGCSSSDDGGSDDAAPTSSSPSEGRATVTVPDDADLVQAVKAYTDAYFKGDADAAHSMLSDRCKEKYPQEVYGPIIEQAAADYGDGHPATDVQADVSGDMARVTYKVQGLPKFDQAQQPWTREGGAWKYDAC